MKKIILLLVLGLIPFLMMEKSEIPQEISHLDYSMPGDGIVKSALFTEPYYCSEERAINCHYFCHRETETCQSYASKSMPGYTSSSCQARSNDCFQLCRTRFCYVVHPGR